MIPHNYRVLMVGAVTVTVTVGVLYVLSGPPSAPPVSIEYVTSQDQIIYQKNEPNLQKVQQPSTRTVEQDAISSPLKMPTEPRKQILQGDPVRDRGNVPYQNPRSLERPGPPNLPPGVNRKGMSDETKVLPQALVIGVKKCGTGTMISFLSPNERVKAVHGEIHFFDKNDTYRNGLEWYRKQMPSSQPGDVTIEGSPAYFVRPWVPERVKQMNSSIRLIMIVRDPTKRIVSDYTHESLIHNTRDAPKYGWGPYPKFEDIVIDNTTGEVNVNYEPVQVGLYHQHLSRWLQYFPFEQIHVVDGETFVEDPSAEITMLEEFLGLPSIITSDHFVYDEEKGFFCLKSAGCMGAGKGRTHPEVDPAVLQKLQDFYRPHNQVFFKMIGRPLPFA